MKKIVIALSFIAFSSTLYSQSFNISANVDDELCINRLTLEIKNFQNDN